MTKIPEYAKQKIKKPLQNYVIAKKLQAGVTIIQYFYILLPPLFPFLQVTSQPSWILQR